MLPMFLAFCFVLAVMIVPTALVCICIPKGDVQE